MANITFLTDFEQGHVFPTFKLAKTLTNRGHKIRYMGIPDISEFVRSQHFEIWEILGDIYPLGMSAKLRAEESRLNREDLFEQHLPRLLQHSELDDVLLNFNPDLLIVSIFVSLEALILWYKHRIPTVIFTPILRLPQADATAHVTQRMMNSGSNVYGFFKFATELDPKIKTFDELGLPLRKMPELIACPKELRLPIHDLGDNVWYIEPSIRETGNESQDFKWPAVAKSKRLIYVSLGSQTEMYLERTRLAYQKLMDMMRMTCDRDWYYIFALGKSFKTDEFGEIPANVTLSRWVPQIDALKRASLMITHGGLGSVKECIFFGVPMVVLPLGRDQFQNAEQITHHRLGTALDLEAVTREELVLAVERILENPLATSGISQMQQIFRKSQESELGADLVEHFLASSNISIKRDDRH